jgi:hypothetical protein
MAYRQWRMDCIAVRGANPEWFFTHTKFLNHTFAEHTFRQYHQHYKTKTRNMDPPSQPSLAIVHDNPLANDVPLVTASNVSAVPTNGSDSGTGSLRNVDHDDQLAHTQNTRASSLNILPPSHVAVPSAFSGQKAVAPSPKHDLVFSRMIENLENALLPVFGQDLKSIPNWNGRVGEPNDFDGSKYYVDMMTRQLGFTTIKKCKPENQKLILLCERFGKSHSRR